MYRAVRVCGLFLLLCATDVHAQDRRREVNGVFLGETPVGTVVRLRGERKEGVNDGGWNFVAYERSNATTVYYFSVEDSIIEWARVFPARGTTLARVHSVLGKPDTIEFDEALSRVELYFDQDATVIYDGDSTVHFIDYSVPVDKAIGMRRKRRAEAHLDSLVALRLMGMPCVKKPCAAWDSAKNRAGRLRWARDERAVYQYTTDPFPDSLQRAATKYDTLCAVVACDEVWRRFRVWDNSP